MLSVISTSSSRHNRTGRRTPCCRHCRAPSDGASRRRHSEIVRSALATLLALTVFAVVLTPASARADGDPASDVLLGENVFYPYSPAVSAGLQKTLNAETAPAPRFHFPIKVALTPAPTDLGAIPALFDKPRQYADFLA